MFANIYGVLVKQKKACPSFDVEISSVKSVPYCINNIN